MTNYKAMTTALSAELLKRETRISERQLRLLRWEQIGEGKLILRQREVKLSETLYSALMSLPCSDRYVFGSTPLLPETEAKTGVIQFIIERISR